MPLKVGPHDGRKARRKRCDGCVKRKIRCHGGIPCDHCQRTSQTCKLPIKPTTFIPVFVEKAPIVDSRCHPIGSHLASTTKFRLPQYIHPKRFDSNLPYFFTSFLPMNIFTSDRVPISTELLEMAKISPDLEDAIHAVAALHRRHREQPAAADGNGNREVSEALQAYTRSVRCVQNKIASDLFLGDPSALWTTFLLGLYELMHDTTGTNWLSHFLHGTCVILRLQHVESLARPGTRYSLQRNFFLTTRIFEIGRSLIYSSPTFLSDPVWITALANFWKGEGVALWHPKEALFDILPSISDLSIRTMRFCHNAKQWSTTTQYALSQSLADEGLALQTALQQWWLETKTWEHAHSPRPSKPDTELLVGYAYYHAISIYLSGTYDYHMHWTWHGAPPAPILPRIKIDWHVSEILRLSRDLLACGMAGVLLFFPLRVAGARAVDTNRRNEILNLLCTTKKRGFIVAEAFIVDLLELWAV